MYGNGKTGKLAPRWRPGVFYGRTGAAGPGLERPEPRQSGQRSTVEQTDEKGPAGPFRPVHPGVSIEQLLQKLAQPLLFGSGQAAGLDLNREIALGVLVPEANNLTLRRELHRRLALGRSTHAGQPS